MVEKMFERDWARACAKEKFTSMLAREHKANSKAKGDDKAMLKEVCVSCVCVCVFRGRGRAGASAGVCSARLLSAVCTCGLHDEDG